MRKVISGEGGLVGIQCGTMTCSCVPVLLCCSHAQGKDIPVAWLNT